MHELKGEKKIVHVHIRVILVGTTQGAFQSPIDLNLSTKSRAGRVSFPAVLWTPGRTSLDIQIYLTETSPMQGWSEVKTAGQDKWALQFVSKKWPAWPSPGPFPTGQGAHDAVF